MIFLKQINKIVLAIAVILIGTNLFIFVSNMGIISRSVALIGEINFPTPKPTPLILPQIIIPSDRKLKVDEVMSILLTLESFGSQTDEKYNFVLVKTKEMWSNLEVESIKAESNWSSWENKDEHYPRSFDEISLADIDILNSPGKEKVLKIIGDTENYRLLIFDKEGDFLGQLGYEWQKYDRPEYWPILVGSIPYLAIRHMVGGGTGTASYVASIYQLDYTGKLRRVLTNIPWNIFADPVVRKSDDGKEFFGSYEFITKIKETGHRNEIPFITFYYKSIFDPYTKSENYVGSEYEIEDWLEDKYSELISGDVKFFYDDSLKGFTTSDIKWEETIVNTQKELLFINIREDTFSGSKVSWNGVVVAKMTYGRIRVKKLPEDEQYPYFVVEDYGNAELDGYTGNIRVYGRVDSMDCQLAPKNLDLILGQCIPWVIIDKIENI